MTLQIAPFEVRPFDAVETEVAAARAVMSAEPVIVPLATPELRTGEWTRHGDDAVLGDPVAERLLERLAASAKSAARAEGYAAGWAEGRRAVEQQVRDEMAEVARNAQQRHMSVELMLEEEHGSAMTVLTNAVDAVQAVVDEARVQVEEQALALALELTEALVDVALGGTGGPVALAVRRALLHTEGEPLLALHLSPDDIGAPETTPLQQRGVSIVPDPSLQPGDALAVLAEEIVDLRLSTARQRVRDTLLGRATAPQTPASEVGA